MYCMYAHVCCMYGMYWPRQALNAYVCVLYVSCMYLFQSICACIACIVCMRMYAVCIVCFCPDKHGCQHNFPKRPPAGPAPRGPHSGHPWAGGRPLFPAIGDPPPDPFWRTGARSTRWGIQSAPPAQPIGIPHAFHARRARPEPRRR